MIDLNSCKLQDIPESVYYIKNFISEEEESEILKNVYLVPKPKWTCLKNRRLQDWGGVPHKNGMIQEDIPSWLVKYMNKVSDLNIFSTDKRANHVLINEYLPGQGIMPHLDGLLFYPTIATISCGSHTVLEFLDSVNRNLICNILLERRSLVIVQYDMYKIYMHSIDEISEDKISDKCANLHYCNSNISDGDILQRDTRISLTIRNVPKVCKLKLK